MVFSHLSSFFGVLYGVRLFFVDLIQGGTLVDVGSGPTVNFVLSATKKFRHIVLSDLVESNRLELQKWLDKSEDSVDWSFRAEQVAALEGHRFVYCHKALYWERYWTRYSMR